MSLKEKLNKLESKGEERKVNLRMPKNKVDLLEKLANQFGTNTSTLIREMIDDAIVQLQKEFIVLDKENGINMTREDGSIDTLRYLPTLVEFMVPELEFDGGRRKDFSSDEDYDNFPIKHAELSVKYGNSYSISGTTPISKKCYEFDDKESLDKIK